MKNVLDYRNHQHVAAAYPKCDRINHCEVLLTDASKDSRYLILPTGLIKHAKSRQVPLTNFVLSIYSANPVFVKKVPFHYPALIISAQLAALQPPGSEQRLGNDASFFTVPGHTNNGCCIYFVVLNKHQSQYLHITTDLSRSHGLSSSRGRNRCRDCIPPLSRMIVMALVPSNIYSGFAYERSVSYVHRPSPTPHDPQLSLLDLHQPFPL